MFSKNAPYSKFFKITDNLEKKHFAHLLEMEDKNHYLSALVTIIYFGCELLDW